MSVDRFIIILINYNAFSAKIFIIPVTNWNGDSGFDGTITKNDSKFPVNSFKNWKSFFSILADSLITLDSTVMQFLTNESDSDIRLLIKAIWAVQSDSFNWV